MLRAMRIPLLLAAVAITAAPLACDKPDPAATSPDAMVVQTVTDPNGSATRVPTGAAPGGEPDAGFGTAASTAVAPVTDAGPSLSTATDAAPGKPGRRADARLSTAAPVPLPTCGDAPLPPCPLYAWMKAKAGPAAGHADADPATLAAVLDQIATFAPPGFPNWVSIARDGAAAARAGQSDAAKASCRGCHTQYKARYKTEMRVRSLS
jgi:hypothetical protein